MIDPDLKRARRLYRARRFREVLRLLEPQIFRYRGHPLFYQLAGLSCLHTGEIGGAHSYLGRAEQLDPENVDVLLGLALVSLERQEPEKAVGYWLRVIDREPRNRRALRGLELLRTAAEECPETLTGEPARLGALAPSPASGPPRWLLFLLGAAAVLLIGSYGAVRLAQAAIARRASSARPEITAVQLVSGSPELLSAATGTPVVFTERELVRAFDDAKRAFVDYRDNLAVHILNRILLSNASAAVKEKARLLKSHAQEPDFVTLRDSFDYDDVMRAPQEYADCHVIWRGRVANVAVGTDAITFDFLVGYEDGRVLRGVLPVRVPFAEAVEDGQSFELLARIEPLEQGGVALEAVSLHRIEPREPSSP